MTQNVDGTVIKLLVTRMEEANIDDNALDVFVYDACFHEISDELNSTASPDTQENVIEEVEKRASSINNEGRTAQLRKLFEGIDYDDVVKLVNDTCQNNLPLKH